MAENKIHHNEKSKLKGSLKKNGFERWRIVFNGISSISGEEKTFLLEFYAVNPALSPKECVLGLKDRSYNSLENIPFIIPGSDAAKNFRSEPYVKPSFFFVRAGVISGGSCLINSYFPMEKILLKQKNTVFSVKPNSLSSCVLSNGFTSGAIKVTEEDLSEHPEYMGNTGNIKWNLNFTKNIVSSNDYKSRDINWTIFGGRTDVLGKVSLNGEEFSVHPNTSFGYYDKNWGHSFPSPYFHLSSSNLTSDISGKLLKNSAFAIQGEYKNRLSILIYLEGKKIEFDAKKPRKYSVTYDCREVCTHEDEEEKLRWQVSIDNKKYIIDIDVFCETKELSLRDFELPIGNRKIMRVLSTGSGNGKFKVYKKIKKALELIEQADISKCLCEYGNIENLSQDE